MGNHRPDSAEREAALEFNRLIGQSSLGTQGASLLRERPEEPDVSKAAPASPAIIPAELVGRFRHVRDLPAGGESDMMVVTDAAGTELVLKLYRAGIVPSPDTWVVLHALGSPHVARLVDWGEVSGRAFEVMEYVGTDTLCDLIESKSRNELDAGTITEIVRQVAAGLNVLHDARVVHRDLKPANILVRSWSPLELALADFGLSRYVENATVFSAAGHTLAYTAPETFAGHVSSARDWWSLGMIVREMATGKPPFEGQSTEVVMLTLASRTIDCLEVADPRLRLLCRGLLARNPAERWGAVEVAGWLAGESPAVHEDRAGPRRSYRPVMGGVTRRLGLVGAAAAVAVIAVVLAGVFVSRPFAPSPRMKATPSSGPSSASSKPSLCAAGSLTFVGSTAFTPIVQDAAKVYMYACPGAKIDVIGEDGAYGTAQLLNAVAAGSPSAGSMIAMYDGIPPVPETAGLRSHPIGALIFSVVAHTDLFPDSNITTDELRRIFVNPGVRGIVAVGRQAASGSRAAFLADVLRLNPGAPAEASCPAPAALTSCTEDSTAALLSLLETTPNAIGYAELSQSLTLYPQVSVLSIDGVAPTPANVRNGSYKFWTVEHLYTAMKSTPLSNDFLGFLPHYLGLNPPADFTTCSGALKKLEADC